MSEGSKQPVEGKKAIPLARDMYVQTEADWDALEARIITMIETVKKINEEREPQLRTNYYTQPLTSIEQKGGAGREVMIARFVEAGYRLSWPKKFANGEQLDDTSAFYISWDHANTDV